MAITLAEMDTAISDGQMQDLVANSILVRAAEIVGEVAPTPSRLAFALEAFREPTKYASAIWLFLIANNLNANLDAILRSNGDAATPTDVTIQNAVNTAVDKFWP